MNEPISALAGKILDEQAYRGGTHAYFCLVNYERNRNLANLPQIRKQLDAIRRANEVLLDALEYAANEDGVW